MASTGEVRPAQEPPSFWETLLQTLRQPRVTLGLLAAWAILGVVAETLSDGLLFDMKGTRASGIFGGRVFSSSAVIPAIVYIWALRNPQQHRRVFWLGLVEQVALVLSSFYHAGGKDISWVGAIIPSIISAGLIFLIFPNLFQPRQVAAPLSQPVGGPPASARQ
jgi:hypothetical protein